MKLPLPVPGPCLSASAARTKGFTLPEVLTAVTVFSFLVGGILAANLFGLRMLQITQTRLGAIDQARQAVGKMTDEIRNANSLTVGNLTNGLFVGHLNGERQTGSGLMICPTTNAANYILYFVNPSDQTFRRTTSAPGTTTILAHSITNTLIFSAQDCRGTVLTNNQNNRVIHLALDFFQPQPQLPAPDYYQLETSVTRRAE